MRSLRKLFLIGVCLSSTAVVLAAENAGSSKPKPKTLDEAGDPVIARVGTLEIRRSELDGIYERLDPDARKMFEQQGGKSAFLEDVANKKRIVLDARRKGIDRSAEVKLDLSVAYDSVVYDRYIQKQIDPQLLSDEELRKQYELRKSSFLLPLRFHARHILVTPKKDEKIVNETYDDARTEEEALKKIEFLKKRLADGADFARLAREYSEESTAERGGDLGWFGKGTMVAEVEESLSKLKTGEVSGAVKSVFGYHLIKLEGREEEGYVPFEKIADGLRAQLLSGREQEISQKLSEAAAMLAKDFPLVVIDPNLKNK